MASASAYRPVATVDVGGVGLPAHFASAADEYRAATTAAAMFDRSDRGLVVVRGKDRATWLHNLVTNAVKTLDAGAGTYAFATDARGRIQFDLNVLCLAAELWLDIDRGALPGAIAHFERYLIMDDARLEDAGPQLTRIGVAGPRTFEVAAGLGAAHAAAMASLSSVALTGESAGRLVRNDFAGLPGIELIVPASAAAAWWDRLSTAMGIAPAGQTTLDVLRTEAGIPWLRRDIDDRTLPPETGQVERGISYHKGCYLGQEIIERMRSHGSLARRLVRVTMADGEGVALPAPLHKDGNEVGKLTTLLKHPLRSEWVGLGYLRTAVQDVTGITTGEAAREVRVAS